VSEHVYQSDPDMAPDSDFEPGELAHLLTGNEGRLLDQRRTPVRVRALCPEQGLFEVEILAFEDRGASWWVPFEDAGLYQFARGSLTTSAQQLADLREAVRRLDRPLHLPAAAGARETSLETVSGERSAAAEWLTGRGFATFDATAAIASREGESLAASLLEEYLSAKGLLEIDEALARTFVSNPRSGELVKGHAIVLAELGLCAYSGKVARDPGLFEGAWSRERRAAHIFARLAFTQALWARASTRAAPLYRALASQVAPTASTGSSLISATFSEDVALEHFRGGDSVRFAAVLRQPLPLGRLFMSFLETREMSRRYREAEAVLLGGPAPGQQF
jgi:hypothetical protein